MAVWAKNPFYNYHWYAFPLLTLLDLFFEDRCNADGVVDFDILYLSELYPTWNSGELAFFTNPEAAWLANPVALAACLADAAAASAGTPIDSLFVNIRCTHPLKNQRVSVSRKRRSRG